MDHCLITLLVASKCCVLQVDQMVPDSQYYTDVDDWDCMLNQTNIGQNNNKYYIIQMLLSACLSGLLCVDQMGQSGMLLCEGRG